jgi:hypothetical protein
MVNEMTMVCYRSMEVYLFIAQDCDDTPVLAWLGTALMLTTCHCLGCSFRLNLVIAVIAGRARSMISLILAIACGRSLAFCYEHYQRYPLVLFSRHRHQRCIKIARTLANTDSEVDLESNATSPSMARLPRGSRLLNPTTGTRG